MKVRIVFERVEMPKAEGPFSVGTVTDLKGNPLSGTELVFKGFFGEDGEPVAEAEMQGEGWIADGDVEAFDVEVYSV